MRSWTTMAAVHGGPRTVVAKGLTGARARGRSGEWDLTVSWGKGGSSGGSSPRASVAGSMASLGQRW
jgi:hypothetical protein